MDRIKRKINEDMQLHSDTTGAVLKPVLDQPVCLCVVMITEEMVHVQLSEFVMLQMLMWKHSRCLHHLKQQTIVHTLLHTVMQTHLPTLSL